MNSVKIKDFLMGLIILVKNVIMNVEEKIQELIGRDR
jgi:hypothetical protein